MSSSSEERGDERRGKKEPLAKAKIAGKGEDEEDGVVTTHSRVIASDLLIPSPISRLLFVCAVGNRKVVFLFSFLLLLLLMFIYICCFPLLFVLAENRTGETTTTTHHKRQIAENLLRVASHIVRLSVRLSASVCV